MKQEKRIQLIQALTKGDINAIENLHQEMHGHNISVLDCLLASHYLLEHGRPAGYTTPLSYDPCCIKSPADIDCLKAGVREYAKSGTFENVDTAALIRMCETVECYRILKEQNQLHLLSKYQHLVTV